MWIISITLFCVIEKSPHQPEKYNIFVLAIQCYGLVWLDSRKNCESYLLPKNRSVLESFIMLVQMVLRYVDIIIHFVCFFCWCICQLWTRNMCISEIRTFIKAETILMTMSALDAPTKSCPRCRHTSWLMWCIFFCFGHKTYSSDICPEIATFWPKELFIQKAHNWWRNTGVWLRRRNQSLMLSLEWLVSG